MVIQNSHEICSKPQHENPNILLVNNPNLRCCCCCCFLDNSPVLKSNCFLSLRREGSKYFRMLLFPGCVYLELDMQGSESSAVFSLMFQKCSAEWSLRIAFQSIHQWARLPPCPWATTLLHCSCLNQPLANRNFILGTATGSFYLKHEAR